MTESEIAVNTPDGVMRTTIVRAEGVPSPLVIVYMPAPGVTSTLLDFARALAAEGYFVVVPHGYYRMGEDVVFDPASSDPSVLGRLRQAAHELTDDMVLSDTEALLGRLREEPECAEGPGGAVGFCMGARHVIRAMARFPDRFVAGSGLHPAFIVTDSPDSPHLGLLGIRGEIYMGFGAADQLTPVELIPRFEEQVHAHGIAYSADVHPGAQHGFMLPGRGYDPAAAERSWQRTLELFGRALHREPVAHG